MHCISNMDPRGQITCLIPSAHINEKLTLSRSLPPAGSHLPPSPGTMRSEEAFSAVQKEEGCKQLEGINYGMRIQKKRPLSRERSLFDVDVKGKVIKDFPLSRKECFLNKGGKYRH